MHLADAYPSLTHSPLNAAEPNGRRKVCIYGAGLGKNEAPLDDPEWSVWALNLVPPIDKLGRLRCDLWFDIHQRKAQTADDLRWIAMCPVPIYVPPDLADASPRAVAYPLDEVEETLRSRYWTCTFAYQIALAMHFNATAKVPAYNHTRGDSALEPCDECRTHLDAQRLVTDIGLYGVELAFGTERERTVEWACTAYWIGRAQQSGIRIHTPRRSLLGRHFARYGFEYTEEIDAVNALMRHHGSEPDDTQRAQPDWRGDVGGR